MAFLLGDYLRLLEGLKTKGYALGPVSCYYERVTAPFLFLRHDVDRFPGRAVKMAQAENHLGVKSTYYFRCNGKGVFPSDSVEKITALGHEAGFHYETRARTKGDLSTVIESFQCELEGLRRITEVKTVAAHGSPLSSDSNSGLMRELDPERFTLLGEPMADLDFSKVFYITDTGGIFGSSSNLRDWSDGKNLRRPTTPPELVRMLIPQKEPMVLLSCHPERWPAGMIGLAQAACLDMGVNLLKRIIRSSRDENKR